MHEEAAMLARQLTDSDPKDPKGHERLAIALFGQGQIAEALASMERWHELQTKRSREQIAKGLELDPNYVPPDASIKELEKLVELEPNLEAVLAGRTQPADAAERADYALLCLVKGRPAAATRLYAEGFPAIPSSRNRTSAAALAAVSAETIATMLSALRRWPMRDAARTPPTRQTHSGHVGATKP